MTKPSYQRMSESVAIRMDSASRRCTTARPNAAMDDQVTRWVSDGASLIRTLGRDLDIALGEIECLKVEIRNLQLDIISRDQSIVALDRTAQDE